jgi:hypothetical protein
LREEAIELGLKMLGNEVPWFIMGEPTGEKPKFCWKGPAEFMTGSSCIWKVSIEKGTCACEAGKAGGCIEWSREYWFRSASAWASVGIMMLFTGGTWGEASARRLGG